MFVRMWRAFLRFLGRHDVTKVESQSGPALDSLVEQHGRSGAAKPVPLVMREVGSGNVQVGYAAGNVSSRVSHHTHSHAHVTVIHASAQAPANEPQSRKPTSAEHSAVLRRMDKLRDRVAVLGFMEREFGTRMVIHLKSEQLFRLNRYLDVVLQDARNVIHRPSAQAKQRRKHKQP